MWIVLIAINMLYVYSTNVEFMTAKNKIENKNKRKTKLFYL